MPLNEPNRRDSWPPTILRLQDDNDNDLSDEDINENPFAYFLTTPTPEDEEDNEFDYFEDLSAGIEGDAAAAKTPVREVSPSSLQRISLEKEDDSQAGKVLSLPLSLRDFAFAHEKRKKDKVSQKQAEKDRAASAMASRGRQTVRLTTNRITRGRGQTRSLSANRRHSWREPSPDVWSIPEENEDTDDVPALSLDGNESEIPDGKGEAAQKAGVTKKTKKRVHWAVLPVRHA